MSLRTLRLACTTLALAGLAGCDYFGTHEGYEDGATSFLGPANMAAFEVVAVIPETASVGDTVTVVTVSDSDAATGAFDIEDFWFCTSDGSEPMVETGGADYEANVDADALGVDLGLTDSELDGSTLSTVTFQIPSGSQTGTAMVITPSGRSEYFELTIRDF